MKPDYSHYSVEQLLDVQRVIDRKRFPERAAEIDWLLKNPDSLKHAHEIQQKRDDQLKSQRKQGCRFCLGVLFVATGLFMWAAGANATHVVSGFLLYNKPVHYGITCAMILFGLLQLYRFFRQQVE